MTTMTFISIADFKAQTATQTIEFLISKDAKLFAVAGNKTYKAQATLDPTKPIRFMYSADEGFAEGCFVNVKPLESKFTL